MLFFASLIVSSFIFSFDPWQHHKDEIIRLEMAKRMVTDYQALQFLTQLQQEKIRSLPNDRYINAPFSSQEIMLIACNLPHHYFLNLIQLRQHAIQNNEVHYQQQVQQYYRDKKKNGE